MDRENLLMIRPLTVTALWVSLTLPVTGCGMDDPRFFADGRNPLVEVLTWWSAPGEAEAVQALIQTHIARNPNARIFNTAVPTSIAMQDLLDRRLGAADPPDLLQVSHRELKQIEQRHPGTLENLDGLFDSFGLRGRVFPEAVLEASQGGKSLAMPVNVHRENGLFYNKALFNAHQLSVPTNIAELIDVCKKFKAAGVTPIATARKGWVMRIMLNSLITGTMGSAAYHAYFTGQSATGLAQLREGIVLLGQILRDYINPDAGEEGFIWANATQALFNGDAAMLFHGDWAQGYLIQLGWRPGIDFGVVAAPGAPDLFVYWVDSLAIPKGAQNTEGAREFLRTVASPEGQVAFNRFKGSTPMRGDLPKEKFDPLGQATLNDFQKARFRMAAPNPVRLDDAVLKFSTDGNVDALMRVLVDGRFEK
jgi:glucose/mannose transport system substrate-binding protein